MDVDFGWEEFETVVTPQAGLRSFSVSAVWVCGPDCSGRLSSSRRFTEGRKVKSMFASFNFWAISRKCFAHLDISVVLLIAENNCWGITTLMFLLLKKKNIYLQTGHMLCVGERCVFPLPAASESVSVFICPLESLMFLKHWFCSCRIHFVFCWYNSLHTATRLCIFC